MNISFLDRVKEGRLCLGTVVSFTDPSVTEAIAESLDFVWVDAEHGSVSLETIQLHMMAGSASNATLMVRVASNDPVLIKPILDLGAHGVIVPLVMNRADAERAVSATRYPPAGVRGMGPRRASRYGRIGGPDFVREANESVITIVQIEHEQAVSNIDDILSVPGISAIMIGPNDLACSMGLAGSPAHPDVIAAAMQVIAAAHRHGVPVGLAMGDNVDQLVAWADRGVQWLSIGADFLHLFRGVEMVVNAIRERTANSTLDQDKTVKS